MDHMTDIPFAIFAFVLMISIIVTIHEYGHYQAARWFGLIGTHFSVGFGGKIASWTDKRGTEWRLSPILIGGYVKFPDDNPEGPKERSEEQTSELQSLMRISYADFCLN